VPLKTTNSDQTNAPEVVSAEVNIPTAPIPLTHNSNSSSNSSGTEPARMILPTTPQASVSPVSIPRHIFFVCQVCGAADQRHSHIT